MIILTHVTRKVHRLCMTWTKTQTSSRFPAAVSDKTYNDVETNWSRMAFFCRVMSCDRCPKTVSVIVKNRG